MGEVATGNGRFVVFAMMLMAVVMIVYLAARQETSSNGLCVVAIFKNEGHILREWLDHYRAEGVSRFLLINNGSDDDGWEEAIGDADDVRVVHSSERHKQALHYNRRLAEAKEFKWVMVVDLDEFVYARGYETIPDFLDTLSEDVDQVKIRWTMFGSNGHDAQPKSVVQSFTRRYHHKDGNFAEGKYIARSNRILKLGVHSATTTKQSETYSIAPADPKAPLRLNHYAIQSKEFFAKVKMTRGSAASAQSDTVRDWNYFARYDVNDVLDDELSIKRETAQVQLSRR